ncbi:hypothetical protein Q604_UNBC07206G0001, partial [human gut metagenome]
SSLKGGNSVRVINGFNKFEFEIVISLLQYRVILEQVVPNLMGKEYQKSLISIGTNIVNIIILLIKHPEKILPILHGCPAESIELIKNAK